jgi:hypothetical protein
MGAVVTFTGITPFDLPADRVLADATARGLKSVVVIGYEEDGGEFFASSIADGADVLWLLERTKHKLMKIVEE